MSRAILKSTSVTGFSTLLSRITGLGRDTAITWAFGVGAYSDAFYVAYKIPNFLRRLFAEGAFSQSFVPVISEYKLKHSESEVRELVAGASGTLGLVLLLVSILGVIGAPLIILLYAHGFASAGDGRFGLAVQMLRWTFPYLFFISLTSLYAGVLNSYQRFALPAFTQVIQNAVLIFAAIALAAHSSNPGLVLSIGVFISGALQLLVLLPAVGGLKLLAWPRWRPAAEGVRRILKLMIPGIIGSSMSQVSLLLDTTIASFLITGSISWLYLADRIMEFPLGVFSIALGTVILPALSAQHTQRAGADFSATLDWALRVTVLLVAPAAVGMLFFSGPMVSAIFGFKKLSLTDVQMASWALMAYSWGLMTFSLIKVLAPGYFARQDTRTPVRAGMIALAVNMFLNIAVALPASRMGFKAPHILLATSTCASSAVNAFLLWRGLRHSGVYQPSHLWRSLLPRVLIACLLMAVLLWWMSGSLAGWLAMPQWQRVWRCLAGIGVAALLYFAVLAALGVRYRDVRTGPVT
jgi:putative peptidoglycan lipid II flippase